jgi:hypothetical protein
MRWPLVTTFDVTALLGGAMTIDEFIHLEWSFPYCSNMDDGPEYAFYGFPFPYIQWGGVSSLEYFFHPLLYAADICAMALVLAIPYFLIVDRRGKRVRRVAAFTGTAALVLMVGWRVFLIAVKAWNPTLHLTGSYAPYSSLRPVGLSRDLHYDCEPLAP